MAKDTVVQQLTSLGWTKEQALGLAANFHQESSFNPAAVGDGGKAYGIGQWHPDRQAEFQTFAGKPIQGSSLAEQVAFADYELRKGKEQSAGKRLAAATDAGSAASIVSQFYERPADRIGEANRRGKTAAAWAGSNWQDEAVPAVAPARQGTVSAPQRPEGWPVLPTYRGPAAGASSASTALLSANATQVAATTGTPEQSTAQMDRQYQATVADHQAREAVGFSDAFQASRHDPRDQALFTILDRVYGPAPETPPEGWTYTANKDVIEAGMSDEEREYLRENVRGPASLATAQAQIAYRRDLDKTYGLAGNWSTFLGRMGGGLMDPVGFAAGVGAGKVLQLAGIGSQAAIAAGRPLKAAGSLLAEGALGNVALESIQDAMGEVKTSSDYAMAASLGVIMTAPFTRGAYATAASKATDDIARSMQTIATGEQARKIAAYVERTGETDPVAVARGVEREEGETLQRYVNEGSSPTVIRDQAVPEDVMGAIREDAETPPVLDTEPAMTEKPPVVEGQPAPDFTPEAIDLPVLNPALLDAAPGDGVAGVELRNRQNERIRLHYDREVVVPDGVDTFSPRDVLARMVGLKEISPSLKEVAKYLRKSLSDDVLDGVAVRFVGKSRGSMARKTNVASMSGGAGEGAELGDHIASLTPKHQEVVLHELVHAATQSKIDAWIHQPTKMTPEQQRIMGDFQGLFERYKAEVDKLFGGPKILDAIERDLKARSDKAESISQQDLLEYRARYGTKNLHEFATTAMTSPEVRNILRRMDGTTIAGRVSDAWRQFVDTIAKLIGGHKSSTDAPNALNSTTAAIDRIISMDGSNIYNATSEDAALQAPALFNGQGQRNYAQRMIQHAQQWVAANPVDPRKLVVLTNLVRKYGGLSDGLILAGSRNPVMQMVSGLVTETTTGAAGRKANVSVRTSMLHRKLVGNAMLDYTNSFKTWGSQNGATLWDNVMHGQKRREFDREVYGEILSRRDPNYGPSAAPEVREAADSLEALFERSRKAQVEAGTLGSGNLPGNSTGYVPQALDGAKLQQLNVQELAAFHDELSIQFQNRLGWDKNFADTFAPYYTDRVRKRAQGSKEVDAMASGGDTLQTVRDTLDDMTVDPAMRDRMTAANQARSGIGSTKKRLDLDLRAEFLPGRTLLDAAFVTDPLILARTYARRVSGNVALTEQGILGIRGVRELREAAAQHREGDGITITQEELESYDRVMAEVLGTPVAGQVVSAGASNLQLLVGLQRLGGLAFTQAAEMFNMIHHVGLRSALSGISSLPRMLGEVGRLKKGQASGNHILTSIEAYGGEIGTDSYKMVAPLDPPEARLEDYVKQSGVLTRLLRAGGHAQSKISFFRGLMSAQHRAAAEQITMRAARFIRDGGNDVALADMGFTPDVVQSMKADLANVAQWDRNGNLLSFDLTQVSDPRTAEAFVQAVHRGTSQIIQGTFIGERSKWMHNDYARLMLQLRTFGLTATEKQLQRTAMIHGGGPQGYAYVAGIMLGQIAMAMPIHAARVQIASAGREDREKYIKDNLNAGALVRSAMNYSSISGSTGDILELTANIAGGWGDAETKEMLGVRGTTSVGVGKLVPVAGTIDTAFKVASGKADLHTALKQLPMSNLPYVIPFISLTKDD